MNDKRETKGLTDEERRVFERGRDQFEFHRQVREASMRAQEAGDTIALQAALENEKWVGEERQRMASKMSKESLQMFGKGWRAAKEENAAKLEREEHETLSQLEREWNQEGSPEQVDREEATRFSEAERAGRDRFDREQTAREARGARIEAGQSPPGWAASALSHREFQKEMAGMSPDELDGFDRGWRQAERAFQDELERPRESSIAASHEAAPSEVEAKRSGRSEPVLEVVTKREREPEAQRGKPPSIQEVVAAVAAQPKKERERGREFELEI